MADFWLTAITAFNSPMGKSLNRGSFFALPSG
jgi:hypothetical protein